MKSPLLQNKITSGTLSHISFDHEQVCSEPRDNSTRHRSGHLNAPMKLHDSDIISTIPKSTHPTTNQRLVTGLENSNISKPTDDVTPKSSYETQPTCGVGTVGVQVENTELPPRFPGHDHDIKEELNNLRRIQERAKSVLESLREQVLKSFSYMLDVIHVSFSEDINNCTDVAKYIRKMRKTNRKIFRQMKSIESLQGNF